MKNRRFLFALVLLPLYLMLLAPMPKQAFADVAVFTIGDDGCLSVTFNGEPVLPLDAAAVLTYVTDPPGMYMGGTHGDRWFGGSLRVYHALRPPTDYLVSYIDGTNEPFLGLTEPLTVTITGNVATVTTGSPLMGIFDFLAAWFANDSRADCNGSGSISTQDIFDFLSAYLT